MKQFTVVMLTEKGTAKVLNGHAGMTLIVDHHLAGSSTQRAFATVIASPYVFVRDYRFPRDAEPYTLWTLGEGDYEVIT
jgi:hypothetical protein